MPGDVPSLSPQPCTHPSSRLSTFHCDVTLVSDDASIVHLAQAARPGLGLYVSKALQACAPVRVSHAH